MKFSIAKIAIFSESFDKKKPFPAVCYIRPPHL